MKKSGYILLFVLLALVGIGAYLLRGADPDHINRQEVIIDIDDNFEK